ncbi:MAG: Strongly-conserved Zn-finger binding protein (TFIIIA) [Candelina mexicana]|nr:MAG: Strongly-conserved Zn-finger binding protein (TFIIIA) [Candelina mexicana]
MDVEDDMLHLDTNNIQSPNALKRKADGEAGPLTAKKAKSQAFKSVPPIEHELSDDAYSIGSSVTSPSEEPDVEASSIATPLTPFSPSRKYPSEEKTHRCPFDDCNKAFNRPARLAEHIRSHNNERPFVCSHEGCNKRFLRESHLSHHIKSAHTDIRDYACEWEGCGKRFLTATRLKRHQGAHEGREKYRCSEYPPCKETFRKHSTLQKHVTSVHLKQKPFHCTYVDPETGEGCSQGYETAGKLRTHEGRVHGGERYQCLICSQDSINTGEQEQSSQVLSFSTYALLQDHNRTVHPPRCIYCEHVCKTQRELRQHVEINHSGQEVDERRTHVCDYPDCGRGFTKKSNLNVHVRTVHGGEKRFVCGRTDLQQSKRLDHWTGKDACGRGFTSKATLEEHVRTQHLGLERVPRRKDNQAHKATETKSKRSSTLSLLTGAGYAEESGRHIACLVPECKHRFMRQYDLEVHHRAKHGFADEDILGVSANTMSPVGGQFWGESGLLDPEDQAAEMELDRQFDEEMEMERLAIGGGQFWVGDQQAMNDEGVGDECGDEQEEMRDLIGDATMDTLRADSEMIDPLLKDI